MKTKHISQSVIAAIFLLCVVCLSNLYAENKKNASTSPAGRDLPQVREARDGLIPIISEKSKVDNSIIAAEGTTGGEYIIEANGADIAPAPKPQAQQTVSESHGSLVEVTPGKDTKVPVKEQKAAAPDAVNDAGIPEDLVDKDSPIGDFDDTLVEDQGKLGKFLSQFQEKGYRPEIVSQPERVGFQRYYGEGLGFKVTDFLSVSARVEIYEEPIPVESYIFALYQKAWYTKAWPEHKTHLVDKWRKSDQRADVRHAFTRAYAYQAILKMHPRLPLVRYTYDRRDMLNVFDPIINGYKLLMQETHEVFLEYAVPFKIPLLGKLIVNPGYQRIRFHGRGNPYASEYRDRYLFHWLFKHVYDHSTYNFNTFMAYEYYEGKSVNTPWIMKPESSHFKVEERMYFPKIKLSVIPGYYYTRINYRPDPSHFILHETFLELNHDFTEKWRATQRLDLRWGEVEHEPNSFVEWEKDVYQPPKIKAQSLRETFKVSYEIIPSVELIAGINWSTGLKYIHYDNLGGTAEIQLFKPGLLRIRFGYFYNRYYHLDTQAEGIQFRAFMFQ